jgi:hypothetical protein
MTGVEVVVEAAGEKAAGGAWAADAGTTPRLPGED